MIKHQPTTRVRGMTLMETVIAIGVIGFAIPMILAGTTASLNDRSNAEADTRAAWIAKDLEQQINALWATSRQFSYLPTSLVLNFPVNGTDVSPLVFIYTNQGRFLRTGTSAELRTGVTDRDAQYLVTLYSTAHHPANLIPGTTSANSPLARVFINVDYPAKARLGRRQSILFSSLKTKQSL
jgi:type II secretory pathway pseudopilin PulG